MMFSIWQRMRRIRDLVERCRGPEGVAAAGVFAVDGDVEIILQKFEREKSVLWRNLDAYASLKERART
jgi:hypothetical protein